MADFLGLNSKIHISAEQRKTLRPFVQGANDVYMEKYNGDNAEYLMYTNPDTIMFSDPIKLRRQNAQVLKEVM